MAMEKLFETLKWSFPMATGNVICSNCLLSEEKIVKNSLVVSLRRWEQPIIFVAKFCIYATLFSWGLFKILS